MKVDLKGMSRKELEKLHKDVEKALTKVNEKELKAARDAAAKAAAKLGFSLEDISTLPARKTRKASGPKTKAAPKYASPADATKTWTGKGRQPVWFKEAITAGKSPESMEIKSS
jgi:DNA-binding protein H-NS